MHVFVNETEKSIFSLLLEQASDTFSNHGCNDFPVKVTPENKDELILFIHQVAEDEDHASSLFKQVEKGKVYFNDWMLLSFLKNTISEA